MTTPPLHRRDFLAACAASVAAWGLPGALHSAETKPRYRSHGPWSMFEDDPRKWILERVMPPAEGKKIGDQIYISSRLENVFYLDLGEHAVVIDAGYDHQTDHHLRNFTALGRDLKKVRAILATHSHVDHTAGLKRAQAALQAPVIAHPLAKKPIETGDLLQTAAVIPELDGWEFDYPACRIDHFVDEGDVIVVGEDEFRVVHIPGHTPDSVGYVWNGHFFTGDAVFFGGLVGWADERWLSNYPDHMDSMQRLLDSPPAAQSFHTAHGPEFPYGQNVPAAIQKTLMKLTPVDEDPCNHTPRATLRAADAKRQTLRLA